MDLICSVSFGDFRYIYTGSVNVNLDVAQDLLRAADQYLLEGLKRLCEYSIAQVILEKNDPRLCTAQGM